MSWATPRETPAHHLAVARELAPPRAFDAACRMVVHYLADAVPMDAWVVTRVVDGHQTVLVSADAARGPGPGDGAPWSATMCRHMVAGSMPRVVPDTRAVPLLADAVATAEGAGAPIGAYVGTPIVAPDGDLFGTVVGLNPEPLADDVVTHESLLDLLSSLLSSVLEADSAATDSARALERAVSDAETDPLTGLLNRRGWERWLAREDERFHRFGDPASVVVLDLDGLKIVNDTGGHAAGDAYLQRTAKVLRTITRSTDPLARLGGDEFGLVAQIGAEDAGRLVARLQHALDHAGTPCSVGSAPFTLLGGFPDACASADAAMYADKRARHAGRSVTNG